MIIRLAAALLAVAGMTSLAFAADLVDGPSAPCECGSTMITIYDVEPGVVTRHWGADCPCRYAPDPRRQGHVTVQFVMPDDRPFAEPWRR